MLRAAMAADPYTQQLHGDRNVRKQNVPGRRPVSTAAASTYVYVGLMHGEQIPAAASDGCLFVFSGESKGVVLSLSATL